MRTLPLCMLTFALLLTSCGQPERAAEAETPANATMSDPERAALQAVADRTGLLVDELTIVSSEYREFRNSSLDCPVAGRSYLQVITPGHQVIVMAGTGANATRIDVRVARGKGRICERPPAPRN